MTRSSGYGRQQGMNMAAHRRPRKRSPLTRVVAAGGAVVCIGAAYEVTAPTVHALSIVFHSPDGSGNTNEVRVNILQGNIFDPQLGLGANVSNNSTSANGTTSTADNPLVDNFIFDNPITQFLNALLSAEIVIGGAAAGPINNTTQISFLSFNVFNPQASIFGGNLSNNTTVANVAMGNGNDTSATSIPNLWTSWFGGMAGNGNTLQLAFLTGNIFNPQWSIFGPNVSNNTGGTAAEVAAATQTNALNTATGNNAPGANTAEGGSTAETNGGEATTNQTGGAAIAAGGAGGEAKSGTAIGGNATTSASGVGSGNLSNNNSSTNTSTGNGNSSSSSTGGTSGGSSTGGTSSGSSSG